MIAFLDGILAAKQPTRVVIGVGGVGYEVFVPLSSFERLPAEGQQCRLLIVECIREDQYSLYGFCSDEERKTFIMLTDVSGVGPRTALSALSAYPPRELKAAIARGDSKLLSSISGIGRKTAERIVVELRDRISALELAAAGAEGEPDSSRLMRDAVLALISLGHKQADAQKRVADALRSGPVPSSVEELVRKSLGSP